MCQWGACPPPPLSPGLKPQGEHDIRQTLKIRRQHVHSTRTLLKHGSYLFIYLLTYLIKSKVVS